MMMPFGSSFLLVNNTSDRATGFQVIPRQNIKIPSCFVFYLVDPQVRQVRPDAITFVTLGDMLALYSLLLLVIGCTLMIVTHGLHIYVDY